MKAQFEKTDYVAWEQKLKDQYTRLEDGIKELRDFVATARDSFTQWVNKTGLSSAVLRTLQAKGGACVTCNRPYDTVPKEKLDADIKEAKMILDEAKVNSEQAEKAHIFYQTELAKLVNEHKINRTEDANRLNSLSHKRDYDGESAHLEMTIQTEKAVLTRQIEELTKEENPFISQMGELADKIIDAAEKAEEANKEQAKVDREVEHLTYWRDVYAKELKLKLFEEACPFLDARVNYHLKRLNNGQIQVNFSTIKRLANGTAKEEFNVHTQSKTGGIGFDSLSGGEQQMVSFSIGLGLADLAGRASTGRSGLLVLDEPFTELDARNSMAVVEYLSSEYGSSKDTILLISNDEQLKGLISNRIHVVKENGVSEVSDGI
jgi:DNA repair exonuclease SbcCD ATPase subunit